MKTYLPPGAGPCAKSVVNAVLVTPAGTRYHSTNFCMKPQSVCPRDAQGYKSGEGYHLCREVCDQPAHAEVNAMQVAEAYGEKLTGSTIYVDYTWICSSCRAASGYNGCNVIIGKAPE